MTVLVYSTGLCHCSVCVPRNIRPEDVAAEVNKIHPTGIENRWELSAEEFADGTPNPHVCNADPDRRHYLLVC